MIFTNKQTNKQCVSTSDYTSGGAGAGAVTK